MPAPPQVSTVDLWPESGRTHQLRRHMLSLGHPIWGDRKYADRFYPESQRGGSEEADEELRFSPAVQPPHAS